MVEVARGGGSKEQIPMVMRVPRFGNQDISACLNSYSLLGFGDILVPGEQQLLISAHCFQTWLLITMHNRVSLRGVCRGSSASYIYHNFVIVNCTQILNL